MERFAFALLQVFRNYSVYKKH